MRRKSRTDQFHSQLGLGACDHRITVNAVAPGPTETELFRANNPPGVPVNLATSRSPHGSFCPAMEIANAIAFLLSEKSGFITGQTLFVDGGASVGKAALLIFISPNHQKENCHDSLDSIDSSALSVSWLAHHTAADPAYFSKYPSLKMSREQGVLVVEMNSAAKP